MGKINLLARDMRNKRRALEIQARLQAKVWRRQMKGRSYDTIAKKLIGDLKIKFPELNLSEIEHIAVGVI